MLSLPKLKIKSENRRRSLGDCFFGNDTKRAQSPRLGLTETGRTGFLSRKCVETLVTACVHAPGVWVMSRYRSAALSRTQRTSFQQEKLSPCFHRGFSGVSRERGCSAALRSGCSVLSRDRTAPGVGSQVLRGVSAPGLHIPHLFIWCWNQIQDLLVR